MTDFLPSDSRLRSLTIDVIFEYFDAPALFTARNDLNYAFLGVAAHRDGAETSYLYVPISENRLTHVRTGGVSLREAFGQPETEAVFVVKVGPTPGPPAVEERQSNDVPDAWLPDEGEYLDETLETAFPFSEQYLEDASRREGRPLLALEIEQPESLHRTEWPLRIGGPLLTEVQELADVVAVNTEFGMTMTLAASLVVVITPLAGDRMLPLPTPAIDSLMEVFRAAGSGTLGEYLSGRSRRVHAHVRDLLTVLADAKTGITAFSASPSRPLERVPVNRDQVASGLTLLRASRELESERQVTVGHLVALNHERRTFVIRESRPSAGRKKPRHFSGKFDPEVVIDGVASGSTVTYRFDLIREPIATEYDEEDIHYRNRMQAMERLSGPELETGT